MSKSARSRHETRSSGGEEVKRRKRASGGAAGARLTAVGPGRDEQTISMKGHCDSAPFGHTRLLSAGLMRLCSTRRADYAEGEAEHFLKIYLAPIFCSDSRSRRSNQQTTDSQPANQPVHKHTSTQAAQVEFSHDSDGTIPTTQRTLNH